MAADAARRGQGRGHPPFSVGRTTSRRPEIDGRRNRIWLTTLQAPFLNSKSAIFEAVDRYVDRYASKKGLFSRRFLHRPLRAAERAGLTIGDLFATFDRPVAVGRWSWRCWRGQACARRRTAWRPRSAP